MDNKDNRDDNKDGNKNGNNMIELTFKEKGNNDFVLDFRTRKNNTIEKITMRLRSLLIPHIRDPKSPNFKKKLKDWPFSISITNEKYNNGNIICFKKNLETILDTLKEEDDNVKIVFQFELDKVECLCTQRCNTCLQTKNVTEFEQDNFGGFTNQCLFCRYFNNLIGSIGKLNREPSLKHRRKVFREIKKIHLDVKDKPNIQYYL